MPNLPNKCRIDKNSVKGKITNKEYQEINEISECTASREIVGLITLNILEQAGTFGADSFYVLITPK
ncbi:hypothetical protein LJC11_01385 [Bacteroidales bacterium OttesenSCG-928-I21]|nr:hypothetical protein [Bacteroidales bacterium OttesenSCG-928-I21]